MSIKEWYKNFKESRPLKIAGGIIILFIVIIIISEIQKKIPETQLSRPLTFSDQTNNPLLSPFQDSDNDSVMDWEEVLWGTNPNNIITFSNTPDKEYIETLRKNKTELGILVNPETIPNVPTDGFSVAFLQSVMALGESEADSATRSALIKRYAEQVLTIPRTQPYTSESFSKSTDTIESRLIYQQTLDRVVDEPGFGDFETDIAFFEQYLIDEDATGLSNYAKKQRELYDRVFTTLELISVPEGLITSHIALMNSLRGVYDALVSLEQVEKNAFIGFAGLQLYIDQAEESQKNYALLVDLL